MDDEWEETDEVCPCCQKGVILKAPWWDDLPENGGEQIGMKYRCTQCDYEYED